MSNELFDTIFIDVILPVPIPKAFTYRVPRELSEEVHIGSRVIVDFGKNRTMTGLIAKVHNTPPQKYQAKYINELLDTSPIVSDHQLWFFQWIADYYMCNIGEVMNVALPSGLKVSSQSLIQINPSFDTPELLDPLERLFFETLEEKDVVKYDEIQKFVGEVNISKFIKGLIAKHAIIIYEQVKEKFSPKSQKKIRLKRVYEGSEEIISLIDSLEKKEKQLSVVMRYLQKVPIHELGNDNKYGLVKKEFLNSSVSASSLQTLIKKGVFEEWSEEISRFETRSANPNQNIRLSQEQETARDQIMAKLEAYQTVLFHGVTGSGKTEVYISLIQQAIENGIQVLLLLPEIALTTQIVDRLKRVFGSEMGVYHSKFSDNERVEVWKGVLEGKYDFVVGVRSSIFLPFSNLGLIIIDEEHESSFKQYDPAPRYHARDAAIMLAHHMGAKVILGSATPSLDSYYQAKNGRYGLVELFKRYNDAKLPEIKLINLREEQAGETIKSDFSKSLRAAIQENLDKKEQVIIFQNRRGYAPYMNCEVCNWIGACHQCSVSLTYHYKDRSMVCHYCGHKEHAPSICPTCGSPKVKTIGVGTEKIEDDLKVLFPEASILRMDLDTTRTKNAYQTIIGEFEKGEIDILVGTQMVSKGLDFDNVSLVGVFNADKMIYFPDFRSSERSFQMLTQVSGRAGRKDKDGHVLIQTNSTNHPVLNWVVSGDYQSFYESEIIERQNYNYPPFARLIKITAKHVDESLSHKAAGLLAERLTKKLGKERVLGPEKPLVERIRNQFLYEIWVKLEKDKINIKTTKAFILSELNETQSDTKYKAVRFVIDVDAI